MVLLNHNLSTYIISSISLNSRERVHSLVEVRLIGVTQYGCGETGIVRGIWEMVRLQTHAVVLQERVSRAVLREEIRSVHLYARLGAAYGHTASGNSIREGRNVTHIRGFITLLHRRVVVVHPLGRDGLCHHKAVVDPLLAAAFDVQNTLGKFLLRGEIERRTLHGGDFSRGDGRR